MRAGVEAENTVPPLHGRCPSRSPSQIACGWSLAYIHTMRTNGIHVRTEHSADAPEKVGLDSNSATRHSCCAAGCGLQFPACMRAQLNQATLQSGDLDIAIQHR